MITRVANIYKVKESENTVYIGRAGKGRDGYFGNPFSKFAREENIEKYIDYFIEKIETDKEFKERIESLRGKTLLCFCKPLACHGDIIAAYLDYELTDAEFAAEEATWD